MTFLRNLDYSLDVTLVMEDIITRRVTQETVLILMEWSDQFQDFDMLEEAAEILKVRRNQDTNWKEGSTRIPTRWKKKRMLRR